MRVLRLFLFAAAAALLSAPASAQVPTLKFGFFTSDTEVNWVRVFKPFIDAVNSDPSGAVKIEGFPNGALGRNLPQQPQMVLDGVADITFVVPSLASGRFPDDTLFEMPGLFKNLTEGTHVFEKLIETNSLRGYDDFVVLGALMNANAHLYSRRPIKTIGDLKGTKVRILGSIVGATVKELGAVPILMPPNEVVEAIGRGTVDSVITVPPAVIDFGIDRVTNTDYLLEFGANSFAVVMSKAKFNSLPPAAQAVIMKYSGKALGQRYAEQMDGWIKGLVEKMKSDPKRTAVIPTDADMRVANAAFANVAKDWAAKDARNAELLEKARRIVADLRAGK
jgi:TRAP-type transport system periplasmic protein